MTTNKPPETLLTISSEPIPLLNLDGKLVTFKDDPLADQAWADLIGLQAKMGDLDPADGEAVQTVVQELRRILGEFIVDGKTDWDTSTSLGFKALATILNAYVEKVTEGIPT